MSYCRDCFWIEQKDRPCATCGPEYEKYTMKVQEAPKKTKYNCPNCAAPIGYHEVCPYCGTALDWVPTVHMTLKVEKRNIRKCVAIVPAPIHSGMTDAAVTMELIDQIGQAAAEVWEREKVENRMGSPLHGVPDGTPVHTATVYFAVKEDQK